MTRLVGVTVLCARQGCGEIATAKVGRWAYCARHAREIQASAHSRAAVRRAPRERVRPGPFERRVLILLDAAVDLDDRTHLADLAAIDADDAEQRWRNLVRALAISEGIAE